MNWLLELLLLRRLMDSGSRRRAQQRAFDAGVRAGEQRERQRLAQQRAWRAPRITPTPRTPQQRRADEREIRRRQRKRVWQYRRTGRFDWD